MEKIPCVYILANRKNGTLYTGVTSNLSKRIHEHKTGIADSFTKRYKISILVYYEVAETMIGAIEREKQIKAGTRKNKIKLIESVNLYWNDLSDKIMKLILDCHVAKPPRNDGKGGFRD